MRIGAGGNREANGHVVARRIVDHLAKVVIGAEHDLFACAILGDPDDAGFERMQGRGRRVAAENAADAVRIFIANPDSCVARAIDVVETDNAVDAAGDWSARVAERIKYGLKALQHDAAIAGIQHAIDAVRMGRDPGDVVAFVHARGQHRAANRALQRAVEHGAEDRGVVLVDIGFRQDRKLGAGQLSRAHEICAELARRVSSVVALFKHEAPAGVGAARSDRDIGLDTNTIAEVHRVWHEAVGRQHDVEELAANVGVRTGRRSLFPSHGDEFANTVRYADIVLNAGGRGRIDDEAIDVGNAVRVRRAVGVFVGPAPRSRRDVGVRDAEKVCERENLLARRVAEELEILDRADEINSVADCNGALVRELEETAAEIVDSIVVVRRVAVD